AAAAAFATPIRAQPIPVPRVGAPPGGAASVIAPYGTVYLRSGARITGTISLLRLGNDDGAAIDAKADRGGALKLLAGDEEVTVHADDIATLVAEWQQFGDVWTLVGVNVVKTDGATVRGRPAWGSMGSRVRVARDDGQVVAYDALRDEPGYDPDNLVLLVDLAPPASGPRIPLISAPPRASVEAALSQPRALGKEVFGTVTLRDGRQFRGNILLAEWGVAANDGVGSSRPDGGGLALLVNGRETLIRAAQVKRAKAEWVNAGTAEDPDWRISAVKVLTRDGREIAGRPTWRLAVSSLHIEPEGGGAPIRIHAFPMSRTFNPDDAIAKIELK
ncbi:MAG: hypothetical protein ACE5O2_04045, partial [Armatimonadota bacterium]